MKTRSKTLVAGLLALTLCGPALAHDPGYGGYYPNPALSGGVTVWGNSQGYSGWSGSLSYGNVYGYAPGYVPWAANHRHGPQCHHAPPRGYAKAYQKGYRHGSRNAYGYSHKHGRGHH